MAIVIHSREDLEQQLVLMKTQKGWSIRALTRHFAISRNTVRSILRKHDALRDEGHDILLKRSPRALQKSKKLDPFEDSVKKILEKYPKITGLRLYEELIAVGYDGGITILRDRLRSLRPGPKHMPVVRFETEPGIQGQMDWSPYRIKFLKTGPAEIQCFSYILGFSRRHFIDFSPRRDFFTLIRRHHDAFAHFGGVPAQCLYDSEKTVVLRWEAGRAVINPAFAAFITHYRCKPVICQRARPETKGKLERWHRTLRGGFLGELDMDKVRDIHDLNARLWAWLDECYHKEPHSALEGLTPLERYRKDLSQIRSLGPFASRLDELFLHRHERLVRKDGTVSYEGHRFEVPFDLIGKTVQLIVDPHKQKVLGVETANGESLGKATPLDQLTNCRRKRRSVAPTSSDAGTRRRSGINLIEMALDRQTRSLCGDLIPLTEVA